MGEKKTSTTERRGRPRATPRRVTALGRALREYRIREGLSLDGLAARTGVPMRSLAAWESEGRAPSRLALRELLAALPHLRAVVE